MKTTFSEECIIQLIRKNYADANNIHNMTEGDTSQTYYFEARYKKFVFQTSRDLQGYKKEAYIYKKYHNRINVRNVLKIGNIADDIYYCITEFIDAKRLQDLETHELIANLEYIMEVFQCMENMKIPENMGFGCFNSEGIASYKTWPLYINAVYNEYQWTIGNNNTKELLLNCIAEIKKHNNIFDNKKSLIHGDFGSSNVLNNAGKVYLIDWSLSLYGDPLYEIANVLFWNEKCLIPLIDEIRIRYLKDEKAIIKIYLYILRIGLEEIYRTVEQNQIGYDIKWVERRVEEIINTFLR
jgi:hygromycin-B 4-O-kinase